MISIKLRQLVNSFSYLQRYGTDDHIPMKIHWPVQDIWEAAFKQQERFEKTMQNLGKQHKLVQIGINREGQPVLHVLKTGYACIPTDNPNIFKIQQDGKDIANPKVAYDEEALEKYNADIEALLDTDIKLPGQAFIRSTKQDDFLPRHESAPPLPFSGEAGRLLNWFIVRGTEPAAEVIEDDPVLDVETTDAPKTNGAKKANVHTAA